MQHRGIIQAVNGDRVPFTLEYESRFNRFSLVIAGRYLGGVVTDSTTRSMLTGQITSQTLEAAARRLMQSAKSGRGVEGLTDLHTR